jgi:mxaA protein
MTPASMRRTAAAVLALAAAVRSADAAGPTVLDATTSEPRAFGYQVGDVVQRRIVVGVPDGLVLDAASLPRPGARGRALELRAVQRERAAGGAREELTLEYQVFLSPPAVRTLEMPAFELRFDGRPRAQELRIDAWPVTVAPLVPVEVSPRRGLGELQPDVEPPAIDTLPAQRRLAAYGVALVLLLGGLAVVYFGLPWWGRRHRPFANAWRDLHALPAQPDDAAWRSACTRLHEALNTSAGEVLFEHGLQAFVRRRPAFAGLHDDIRRFLALSRRTFFADGARAPDDAAWLVGLARRCRDAERGT